MRIAGLLLCLALAGCMSEAGQQFSSNAASDIRNGSTSKDAVRAMLGEPLQKTITPNGDETWVYTYFATKNDAGERAAAGMGLMAVGTVAGVFIPGAGLIAAAGPLMANPATTYNSSTNSQKLTITFKRDIVQSCMLMSTIMETTGGVIGATQPKSEVRQINCTVINKYQQASLQQQ